jgi:preprotein translocase subunit SecG
MYTILVIVQVLAAVALIGLILIQHGKGADAGAAFGSGASGTVFGSRGSANFLSRSTAWLATVFFIVSLALAYLVHGQRDVSDSVVDRAAAAAPAPATPDEAAPAPAPVEEKNAPAVPE